MGWCLQYLFYDLKFLDYVTPGRGQVIPLTIWL